jgi:TolB-like protein
MKVPEEVDASEDKYPSIPRAPLGDGHGPTATLPSYGRTSASHSLPNGDIASLGERWTSAATLPKPPIGAEPVEALCFGTFEVDLGARELRKNGVPLELQEQPFQILEMLVTRAGETVARKHIQERLWPQSFVCFDRCINTGVSKLRQVLGDSVQDPRYIETRSRRGYRFIAPLKPTERTKAPAAQGQKCMDSIAVLPFQNASGGPELEYLSDSITESVIHGLSELPGMRVMARSMVFGYKDRDVSPQDVGRELRVGAVLTGRIVQHDGKLAIDAELVDVDSGWRLWGERCTPEASDVLAVQEEISRKISERLGLRLSGV